MSEVLERSHELEEPSGRVGSVPEHSLSGALLAAIRG